MAIANHSPLSNWRGRAGGQVYRVRAGEQIVTAYQPNVSNPRTDGQLQQRAKLALAGKISSILHDEMIYGLASSRTARRAALLSILTSKATAMLDPLAPAGERRWLGRIFPTQIELSKGFDYINTDDGEITASINQEEILVTVDAQNLQFLAASGNEDNKVLIVDIYGRTVSFGDAYVGAEMRSMDSEHMRISFAGEGVHRLYAIPVNNVGNGTLTRPHYGDLVDGNNDETTPVQVAGVSTVTGGAERYGKSVFLGEFILEA